MYIILGLGIACIVIYNLCYSCGVCSAVAFPPNSLLLFCAIKTLSVIIDSNLQPVSYLRYFFFTTVNTFQYSVLTVKLIL